MSRRDQQIDSESAECWSQGSSTPNGTVNCGLGCPDLGGYAHATTWALIRLPKRKKSSQRTPAGASTSAGAWQTGFAGTRKAKHQPANEQPTTLEQVRC